MNQGEDATIDVRRLREHLSQERVSTAAAMYVAARPHPDQTRQLFSELTTAEGAALMAALTDETMSRAVLLWLPPDQAASIASEMTTASAARLIGGLPSDERADLLAAMEKRSRAAVHAAMPPEVRADTARLLKYSPDTAGGLMETECLTFPATATARDAIREIRAQQEKFSAIGVQYLYILDEGRRLLGVAPLRDLILAAEESVLASLVKRAPASVREHATMKDLSEAFEQHPFLALPVVSQDGLLLGVVTREDVRAGEHEEAEDDYRVSHGIVGGEELRSMPVGIRLRRRSMWLGVNLVLCLGGAAVIALHQDTLARALVVVAVLPVISATSGNAAMQAAAVSIRELTLGIIEPKSWRRVLVHELTLAVLVSAPLGVAVALLAAMWRAPMAIGVAVGVAMALNTLIAIGVGCVCPLLLRCLRVDPALASGPISTTLADVSGFALTLWLVSIAA